LEYPTDICDMFDSEIVSGIDYKKEKRIALTKEFKTYQTTLGKRICNSNVNKWLIKLNKVEIWLLIGIMDADIELDQSGTNKWRESPGSFGFVCTEEYQNAYIKGKVFSEKSAWRFSSGCVLQLVLDLNQNILTLNKMSNSNHTQLEKKEGMKINIPNDKSWRFAVTFFSAEDSIEFLPLVDFENKQK